MPLAQNKAITFNYTLKDDEGNILDTTKGSSPFSFLSGNGQILPKLEDEMSGMLLGSKKNVKIDAADAYGEYNEEAVQKVERTNFPKDVDLQPGMQFVTNSPDGHQMPFIISEIKEDDVTIDFNHPLAGKNLEFDVELLDIRDATTEEIAHGHIHGQGGHHH
ncbi:MAG: peptidylprolyl isomerase [Ignavibacteriaceae bacterium]|nr:peptidylprolyl isomerase [Ignavibacteriaceae bacterium]